MNTPDNKKPKPGAKPASTEAPKSPRIEGKGNKKEQIKEKKASFEKKSKKIEETVPKKGGMKKISEKAPGYASSGAMVLLGIITGAWAFLLLGGLFGVATGVANAEKKG